MNSKYTYMVKLPTRGPTDSRASFIRTRDENNNLICVVEAVHIESDRVIRITLNKSDRRKLREFLDQRFDDDAG